ncbi:hypothetical protein [Actinomadura sediminis]|uniref:Uncharacterized protein n=1 Tax=Actinomadura sediminis TaxID=1038904 RepID=A0ABW3ELF2_9ACTN
MTDRTQWVMGIEFIFPMRGRGTATWPENDVDKEGRADGGGN